MREFGFELSLCAHLEAGGAAAPAVPESPIVARQLGGGVAKPGGRILDAVCLEPGPRFEDRAAITAEGIPDAIVDSALGPGQFRRVTSAIDARPDRARSIAQDGAEIGVLECERRSGQLHARQVARYPSEWFGELVGIENKPDLGTPGALEDQLRIDVSLGLVDRVVLATESYVTGAHRNRIPDAVGIWRFDPEDGDLAVLRAAARLPVDESGVEVLERSPGRASIEIVPPASKARARRRIAERAYGKGWRTFAFPPCAEIETDSVVDEDVPERPVDGDGPASLPRCRWKGRLVDPASDCGEDCPGFETDDPPAVDLAAERAAASPWVADPAGYKRTQAGLDRF